MITRDVTVIIDGPSSSSTARYSKVANFQFQLRLSQQDSNQFARLAHQKWAANRGSTGMNSSASRSAAECLFRAAGSTGRRNTGVKSLRWGFKLQGLTGSFVELTSHFVQIGL